MPGPLCRGRPSAGGRPAGRGEGFGCRYLCCLGGGSFAEQGSVSKATSRLLLAQLASFLLSFQSYVILGRSS